MEDYHVAKFVQCQGRELGLFAIFDGHLGDKVPAYLQKHLFQNIIKEVGFRSETTYYRIRLRLQRLNSAFLTIFRK